MTARSLAALVLAATLAMPLSANAYFLTCAQSVDAITNGTPVEAAAAVGDAAGAADVLAGLLCLVNSPSCSCLSNAVVNQSHAFSSAFGTLLADCFVNSPNAPAFLSGMRAARVVCGLPI